MNEFDTQRKATKHFVYNVGDLVFRFQWNRNFIIQYYLKIYFRKLI